jgi:cell envelope opacity-associated protein A
MFQTAFQVNAFQNNAFQINAGPPPPQPSIDTHDGFTKRDIERAKELDRKRRAAEQKLIEARRADAEARKKRFRDAIDPVAPKQQTKKNKVQLKQEIRIDTPSVEVTRLKAVIANLDKQEKELNKAIAHRKMLAETMSAIAYLEAQFKAEQDDEEALLMLL